MINFYEEFNQTLKEALDDLGFLAYEFKYVDFNSGYTFRNHKSAKQYIESFPGFAATNTGFHYEFISAQDVEKIINTNKLFVLDCITNNKRNCFVGSEFEDVLKYIQKNYLKG
jgi:hypothetical protein